MTWNDSPTAVAIIGGPPDETTPRRIKLDALALVTAAVGLDGVDAAFQALGDPEKHAKDPHAPEKLGGQGVRRKRHPTDMRWSAAPPSSRGHRRVPARRGDVLPCW